MTLIAAAASMLISAVASADPIRFGAMRMPAPDPCMPFITDTYLWLNSSFPDGATFKYYEVSELEQAVRNREVDVVLTEAGIVGRLRLDGATPIFSAVSARHPDPKRSQGAVFFVRSDREDLGSIANLKNKVLSATAKDDFTGYQAAMGELVRRSYIPSHFFSDIKFVGTSSKSSMKEVVESVVKGDSDVGIVRTCFIEDLSRLEGRALPVKVVEPRNDPSFACMRSTELYPNWTISSVPSLSASDVRKVMEILLGMPKTRDGMYWSAAYDFSSVDRLMKALNAGPFEDAYGWTLRRIYTEFETEIKLVALFVILASLHYWRTSFLLRRRTKELQDVFSEKERLMEEARDSNLRFEKLQRSMAVSQMSSMFAHELKQPLHAISCISHGLKSLIDKDSGRKELMVKSLEKIGQEVNRADGVINRVRNYAKGRDSDRKKCSLVGILKEAVGLVRTKAESSIIAVEIEASPSLCLMADSLELQVAFYNLISNAVEASLNNASPRVVVRARAEAEVFLLEIEDNGVEVSDDDFKRMTTPLSSSKSDGLGLGIMLTKSILEKYRGRLYFIKIDGGGVSARVEIPCFSTETK